MEAYSALLAICAGNSPVPGKFPAQRSVTRSFDVFFDLHPNKRLSKQLWGWWIEVPSWSLWRHRNAENFVATVHEGMCEQIGRNADLIHMFVAPCSMGQIKNRLKRK